MPGFKMVCQCQNYFLCILTVLQRFTGIRNEKAARSSHVLELWTL